MNILANLKQNLIKPVQAHCDLMCGVYDPAQARIEAESVLNAVNKYHDSDDEIFRQRAVQIKEERAEICKNHLWVLWTDFFKPNHLDAHEDLHDLFWKATKAAGDAKKTMNVEAAEELIRLIDEVGRVFEKVKDGYDYQRVLDNINA